MSGVQAKLPMRESTQTSWLSRYRYFWRGSEWELFLDPVKGGFAVARTAPQAYSCTHLLMDQPGVYELAIVKRGASQSINWDDFGGYRQTCTICRYKVYVGQTSSLRRRFHQEYRGSSGSHLKSFFEEALQNGCQVWRRCQYVKTAEDARKKEAQLLKTYDYAWNSRQAGCRPRHINIVISRHCFSKSVMLVSRPVEGQVESSSPLTSGLKNLPTGTLALRPPEPAKPPVHTTAHVPLQIQVSTTACSPDPQSRTTRSWSEVPSLRFDT